MHPTVKARRARARALLRRLVGIESPSVAEVGVFVGAFSEVLLSLHLGLCLTMVDSWAPAEELPDSYRQTGDVHANQSASEAATNKREAEARVSQYGNRTTIVHLPSLEAAAAHLRTFDLVFLDADHSYEAVKADLAAWVPAIKPGGWIGGHDYDHDDPQFSFGVKQAVDEWASANGLTIELGADFSWFCRLP